MERKIEYYVIEADLAVASNTKTTGLRSTEYFLSCAIVHRFAPWRVHGFTPFK